MDDWKTNQSKPSISKATREKYAKIASSMRISGHETIAIQMPVDKSNLWVSKGVRMEDE